MRPWQSYVVCAIEGGHLFALSINGKTSWKSGGIVADPLFVCAIVDDRRLGSRFLTGFHGSWCFEHDR